jgi:SAM-dependent methyltransferase
MTTAAPTSAVPPPSAAKSAHAGERSVFDLYRTYPFPQTTAEQRRAGLAYQLCKYKYLGVEEAWRGRVLDAGCGTGRTMLVPKHYGTKLYVGMDQSEVSLEYAKKVAREDGVQQFKPVKGSLFQMPFDDNTFDLVVSWGVLHCTPDPLAGLKEMTRVCKRGGFVAFFVYNPFTHWRHNIERWRVRRLAGEDFEARFKAAHRLYGKKPVEQMNPQELTFFFDRYCVPIESNHTYGEMLSWLDAAGLEYWGSSSPLRLRDFVGYLQTLSTLIQQFGGDQSSTRFHRFTRRIADLSTKLPGFKPRSAPYARPTILHRAFWQTLLAWHGRHSGAFHVSSVSGRKR